jgi:formylglycine-generating enzyme required for sulfatase activity
MSDPVQLAKNPRHVITWPEGGVEMAFRLIPAGSFRMGSRGFLGNEEPVHQVVIPEGFWMAETPVTQAQFALWTSAEGIEHKNYFEGHPDTPADCMDWRQAVGYCAWLTRTKARELPEGFSLACLPTEAEWEYACRAGTETEYYTGDGEAALAEAGWYGEDARAAPSNPVGRKQPNAFGLFDMHGNMWEWCHDVWDPAAYRKRVDGAPDPGCVQRAADFRAGTVVKENGDRVRRGGSWLESYSGSLSACRNWGRFDHPNWLIGFRVCLVRGPAWTAAIDRRSPKEGSQRLKAEG